MHGTITLKINGVERPLRLNNHFLFELGAALGVDAIGAGAKIMEIAAANAQHAMYYIVYAGLIGAQYEKANFVHGVDKEEIAQFIATADFEIFTPVYQAFSDVMRIPEVIKSVEDDPAEETTEEKKS